ncbi:hypothetical protein GASC598I20_023540 [Gilliamella apicola SCGC AB-598-I20]|nr:hypothetical protein GASC598I20_023540 [Gilliamella apicola SCGC AB-598-I20]
MNSIERSRQLEHIRRLYQLIHGHRSLVRSNFNRLKPGQKRLLLAAAGITPLYAGFSSSARNLNYDLLNDEEIDRLEIGLRRLQSIVDVFAHCEPQDFTKQ